MIILACLHVEKILVVAFSRFSSVCLTYDSESCYTIAEKKDRFILYMYMYNICVRTCRWAYCRERRGCPWLIRSLDRVHLNVNRGHFRSSRSRAIIDRLSCMSKIVDEFAYADSQYPILLNSIFPNDTLPKLMTTLDRLIIFKWFLIDSRT